MGQWMHSNLPRFHTYCTPISREEQVFFKCIFGKMQSKLRSNFVGCVHIAQKGALVSMPAPLWGRCVSVLVQRNFAIEGRAVQLFPAAQGLQHGGGDVGKGLALAQIHAFL